MAPPHSEARVLVPLKSLHIKPKEWGSGFPSAVGGEAEVRTQECLPSLDFLPISLLPALLCPDPCSLLPTVCSSAHTLPELCVGGCTGIQTWGGKAVWEVVAIVLLSHVLW